MTAPPSTRANELRARARVIREEAEHEAVKLEREAEELELLSPEPQR